MDINERIKIIRKELKMTQLDFARKLFMTNDAISNIERGLNPPAQRTIELICSTFNVNKDWLETGEGEMFILPEDEDLVILAKLFKLGQGHATIDALMAVFKVYLALDEEQRASWDQMVYDAVAKTKKDPE